MVGLLFICLHGKANESLATSPNFGSLSDGRKTQKGKVMTWRDVLDCKNPGEHILETARRAVDADYCFICHNGKIWFVTEDEELKIYPTGLDVSSLLW